MIRIPIAATLILLAHVVPHSRAQCADWTPGYHVAGIGSGQVAASALFDDGSGNGVELYLGGAFSAAGDVPATNIVKWNGTRWSAVGAGLPTPVISLCVWNDGSGAKLYAGGNTSETVPVGGTLTKINAWDGTSWTGLPGGITHGLVQAMVAWDDGSGSKLYVGTACVLTNQPSTPFHAIARFDGTSWSYVGSGLIANSYGVTALAVHDDGSGPKLFAGATQLSASPGGPRAAIWRFDGATWSDAGLGFTNITEIFALAVTHSSTGVETLYATGKFTTPSNAQRLCFWNGTGWVNVGQTTSFIRTLLEIPQPGADSLLAAGGDYYLMSGMPNSSVAIWSNSQWSAAAANLGNPVYTLALYDEGAGAKLFAGMSFAYPFRFPSCVARLDGPAWVAPGRPGAGEVGTIEHLQTVNETTGQNLYASGQLSAGGEQAVRVTRFTGSTWTPTGPPFAGGFVDCLGQFDDGVHGRQLYAAGGFTSNGGFGVNRVARWDGSNWNAVGTGVASVMGGGVVHALTEYDDGSGKRMIAVGNFNLAGGAPAPFIAAWDGTSWSSFGAGMDAQTRSAVVFDDGTGPALYVGGYFQHAGGIPARYVARWNGTAWNALANGTASVVHDLLVHDDGHGPKLYARTPYGATPIERWDGVSWQSLPGGPTTADAIASYDDGTGGGPKLYVAGTLGAQYGVSFDGTSWSPIESGLTGVVKSFAVHDDGNGPALFAGGSFVRSGNYVATNAARFGPTGACTPITGTPFCAGDGSGTACPCGNNGAVRRGCASSSNPAGALLSVEGQSHLSGDTVTLRASGMGASASLLFFQGTGQVAGGAGAPFGDGLRCVNGAVVRLAVRHASGGSAAFGHGVTGDPSVSVAGHLGALWSTRNYQAWYRDAQSFCTSSLFNLTNGVSIRWAP